MKTVCVFCGSAEGVDDQHKQFARDAGRLVAEEGMRLIYGGGDLGLMGLVARACEEHGGDVIGVIPEFLNKAHIVSPSVTARGLLNIAALAGTPVQNYA